MEFEGKCRTSQTKKKRSNYEETTQKILSRQWMRNRFISFVPIFMHTKHPVATSSFSDRNQPMILLRDRLCTRYGELFVIIWKEKI
ncbi:hypothetical protein DERF_003518 [Dermatophagoides farinae]|uniref:Uncharacterized protein n=1 Tax=Dermatophagoides farinae TaxID=6954 RepID=A0A922LAN1_DERFA|nr:hypothetical protein DERF_003518 [Dermatophagoides farinae]